jgi:Mn-containing catalase
MFYHSSKLQFAVRVDKPNPLFAKMLQQAIGGIEGEIRVAMQYFFQAMGARGPTKNTATCLWRPPRRSLRTSSSLVMRLR